MKYKPIGGIKYADYNMTGHSITRWVEYRRTHNFSVGDYLIKKVKNHEFDRWDIEPFSEHRSEMHRKYIVLKIDKFDVPHVAPIVFPGSIGKNAFPLCNVDLDYERFELDPEYETYLILDKIEEYDPLRELTNEIRESTKELNRRIDRLYE